MIRYARVGASLQQDPASEQQGATIAPKFAPEVSAFRQLAQPKLDCPDRAFLSALAGNALIGGVAAAGSVFGGGI
jgi:LPS O-antigen subunit length determinant protein (WzzB/FepE family)